MFAIAELTSGWAQVGWLLGSALLSAVVAGIVAAATAAWRARGIVEELRNDVAAVERDLDRKAEGSAVELVAKDVAAVAGNVKRHERRLDDGRRKLDDVVRFGVQVPELLSEMKLLRRQLHEQDGKFVSHEECGRRHERDTARSAK